MSGSRRAIPVVLAITGASGAPYAVRLLEVLARDRVPVWLIVSSHGLRLLEAECGIEIDGRAARRHRRRLVHGHARSPTATAARFPPPARSAPAAW